MLSKIIGKIFSSSGSQSNKYTAEELAVKLNYCGKIEIDGTVQVIEPRELIIGENVKIGKNVKLYCYGGLLIGDNVIIADNVCLGDSKIKSYEDSTHILRPILIPANTVIKNSSDLNNIVISNQNQFKNDKKLFFVFSTGRSGSKAFSNLFSTISTVNCKHESFFLFNRLSTNYEHGIIKREELKLILHFLFTQINLFKHADIIYGESDQKLVSFIPILKEIVPQSKFIWLLRRAEGFVASAYGRGWFDDHEYAFHKGKIYSPDSIAPKTIFDKYRLDYSIFRLNGYRAGIFSSKEWNDMDSFERNCWYWNYWNEKIESAFNDIPEAQKFIIRLEELEVQKTKLFDFLNLNFNPGKIEIINEATYKKFPMEQWNKKQQQSYKKWCEKNAEKWYNP